MIYKQKKSWEISENLVTDKADFLNRREFVKKAAIASIGIPLLAGGGSLFAKSVEGLTKNPKFALKKQELTDKQDFLSYNNFYEFSLNKYDVKANATKFKASPWTVEIKGLVNNPMKLDVQDILSKYEQEERIYRFRCVETWSAVVPWVGFPLSKLLKAADPKSEAKFVAFKTFYDPKVAPNQNSPQYNWPYSEGLRLDEAMHDLSIVGTGLYGEYLQVQNGAPIRIVVPWKYGFKSIKSIVSIELVDRMPKTLWNTAIPSEYGFYANVNPEVDHPRWSQGYEKPVGTFFGKNRSRKFNGYPEVAYLYEGMNLRRDF